MKLFSVGGTDVKCSPLLIMLLPLAFVFHREALFFVAFISLSVHELAHAMMAARLGFSVSSVEIQPFGFVARMELSRASAPDIAAVYAAGPAASLIMASVNSLVEGLIPAYAAASLGVSEYCLLICAVNLLPALPLDGGRLIYAALSGSARVRAQKRLRVSGACAGAGFLLVVVFMLTQGFINPTFAVMGGFLIYAALRGSETPPLPSSRHSRVAGRSTVPVGNVAVSESMALSEAFSALPPGRYSVLSVIDSSGRRVAELDEYSLMEAAKSLSTSSKLKDAVEMTRRGML